MNRASTLLERTQPIPVVMADLADTDSSRVPRESRGKELCIRWLNHSTFLLVLLAIGYHAGSIRAYSRIGSFSLQSVVKRYEEVKIVGTTTNRGISSGNPNKCTSIRPTPYASSFLTNVLTLKTALKR